MYKLFERKKTRILFYILFMVVVINYKQVYAIVPDTASSTNVVTVSSSNLTNQTVTVVGNANALYAGNTYNVTSLDEYKTRLNEAISSCAESVTLVYSGNTALSIYPTGLSTLVTSILQIAGNDYEKILLKQWSVSYTTPATPGFTATYSFVYLEDAIQRSQVSAEVARILGNIITPGMTDEQKEKAICDYIILNTSYDTSLVQHSAYAALFGNKKTVCQGYALLTYRMLTDAGMTARIVTGKGNGVGHAWNMVVINGKWYQLDNTWDDPVPDVIGRVRYDFFNLQDSQMLAKGHTWDTTTMPLYYPIANSIYVPTDTDIITGGRSVDYKTNAPSLSQITVTNNLTGIADTIKITGLSTGDVVKVYNVASGGTALYTATIASVATSASFTVPQLGTSAGSLYISLRSINQFESDRTEAQYLGEPKTNSLSGSAIQTTNNVGKADTVKVIGLTTGDIIKVYKDATITTVLGSATVATGATMATVNITQLGTIAGSVYVTIKSPGKLESDRTKSDYIAEPVTDVPLATNTTVTNYAGKADTINVTGLAAGNIVKVYAVATGGTPVGTATVASTATMATASVAQLGATAGSVYVTVTATGKIESPRVQVSYIAEVKTTALNVSTIETINNVGKSDTIKVTGVTSGDVVKVYRDTVATTVLGTVTVATGATAGTVTITQLGTAAGSVYVTLTNPGKQQSDRTKSDYIAEPVTDVPLATNITVANYAGKADTINVTGLAAGNIVKVYAVATGGTPVGTAPVSSTATMATASVAQLGTATGSVYVTVTATGKIESPRVQVSYLAEEKTTALNVSTIETINNVGKADTIKVTGLIAGDVIKVYRDTVATTVLGTVTVATGATTGTVTITQLGTAAGSVYITVTNPGKQQSDRTKSDYIAEPVTDAPLATNTTVTNYAGKADTINVTGLAAGNIVKVYAVATGGTPVGTAPVASAATMATASVAQLGTTAGSVYVTVTATGKIESPRVQISYLAEEKTTALNVSTIETINNVGKADTIKVTGLIAGDVIKVYRDTVATTVLGTVTVATGATTGTVTITQLGTAAGSVYITVTNPGKQQSDRTKSDYISEN